jgi:hypothetical protein
MVMTMEYAEGAWQAESRRGQVAPWTKKKGATPTRSVTTTSTSTNESQLCPEFVDVANHFVQEFALAKDFVFIRPPGTRLSNEELARQFYFTFEAWLDERLFELEVQTLTSEDRRAHEIYLRSKLSLLTAEFAFLARVYPRTSPHAIHPEPAKSTSDDVFTLLLRRYAGSVEGWLDADP